MYISKPSRIAVLLGAQTPKGSYLPGVFNDLENINNYLYSPNSGAWKSDEIFNDYDSKWRLALNKVKNSVADYTFTYFSGHGYQDNNGELRICFRDGDVPASNLINDSPRQLILVDACTKRTKTASIGAIKWPSEKWNYATGYSFARELFDQCILDSGFGKLMIYATDYDNYAYENEQKKGGEFTLSLLDAVMTYQQTQQQGLLFIEDVIKYSTSLLQQRRIPQIPSYVYKDGFFKVPFGIISQSFVTRPPRVIEPIKGNTNNVLSNIFLGTGIVLTIYGLSKL